MICIACDATVKGTVYSFGKHSPLCRDCAYELEALEDTRERHEKRRAEAARRDLGFLGRLFRGIFGGGK